MKVFHLLKTSVAATWALRQIWELVKQGFEMHAALPGGGPMVRKHNDIGATEHLLQTDFPILAPWRITELADKLSVRIQIFRWDIIHCNFVGSSLAMRLIL